MLCGGRSPPHPAQAGSAPPGPPLRIEDSPGWSRGSTPGPFHGLIASEGEAGAMPLEPFAGGVIRGCDAGLNPCRPSRAGCIRPGEAVVGAWMPFVRIAFEGAAEMWAGFRCESVSSEVMARLRRGLRGNSCFEDGRIRGPRSGRTGVPRRGSLFVARGSRYAGWFGAGRGSMGRVGAVGFGYSDPRPVPDGDGGFRGPDGPVSGCCRGTAPGRISRPGHPQWTRPAAWRGGPVCGDPSCGCGRGRCVPLPVC